VKRADFVKNHFENKIENQHWLGTAHEDLCSHGELYLNVNGTVITKAGVDEEWGISESALALLRTLDEDYIADPINGEGLILHGCGVLLMVSCPITIHWTVNHMGDKVELSDFVKVESTNPETGSVYYRDLQVTLSRTEFVSKIISFAQQAKRFFDESEEKVILDDFDKTMYDDFWSEYNRRLT
jgi:hypothetical protein